MQCLPFLIGLTSCVPVLRFCMKNKLTMYILVAMAPGIGMGWAVHNNASPAFQTTFAANIKLLATIFIRLVQMIIAPLVFSAPVVGIGKLGDLKAVGRLGSKALLWFVTASLMVAADRHTVGKRL